MVAPHADATAELPNKPQAKLPPLPQGSRITKRPIPVVPARRQKPGLPAAKDIQTPDSDGYLQPSRAPHTTVIYVTSKAPFMALVKRVRKALDSGPQQTRGLPLTARITALHVRPGASALMQDTIEDAFDDVVLIGTGRAIRRTVEVGAFFTRQSELLVLPRTRTLSAVDDVIMDEDQDAEDQVRVRNVSCIEVGIRWRC